MATDWYRNTTWNESVERAFDEKLRRAKNKDQYLRIQACTLARSHPEVALKLLDRYFALPDDCHDAPAHGDRATALLALGHVTDAIASYEAALAREAAFPNLQTQAYLELPYVIATRRVRDQYDRALQVLRLHEARLTFPVEHFQWHAARAFIAADVQDSDVAVVHARQALEAAALDHSGFRDHASLGLVTEEYDDVIRKLHAYCAE